MLINLNLARSALFNSTVAAYDPYSDKFVDIIKFPGFTRNPKNHIGGVGWDQNTGLVSYCISFKFVN